MSMSSSTPESELPWIDNPPTESGYYWFTLVGGSTWMCIVVRDEDDGELYWKTFWGAFSKLSETNAGMNLRFSDRIDNVPEDFPQVYPYDGAEISARGEASLKDRIGDLLDDLRSEIFDEINQEWKHYGK